MTQIDEIIKKLFHDMDRIAKEIELLVDDKGVVADFLDIFHYGDSLVKKISQGDLRYDSKIARSIYKAIEKHVLQAFHDLKAYLGKCDSAIEHLKKLCANLPPDYERALISRVDKLNSTLESIFAEHPSKLKKEIMGEFSSLKYAASSVASWNDFSGCCADSFKRVKETLSRLLGLLSQLSWNSGQVLEFINFEGKSKSELMRAIRKDFVSVVPIGSALRAEGVRPDEILFDTDFIVEAYRNIKKQDAKHKIKLYELQLPGRPIRAIITKKVLDELTRKPIKSFFTPLVPSDFVNCLRSNESIEFIDVKPTKREIKDIVSVSTSGTGKPAYSTHDEISKFMHSGEMGILAYVLRHSGKVMVVCSNDNDVEEFVRQTKRERPHFPVHVFSNKGGKIREKRL